MDDSRTWRGRCRPLPRVTTTFETSGPCGSLKAFSVIRYKSQICSTGTPKGGLIKSLLDQVRWEKSAYLAAKACCHREWGPALASLAKPRISLRIGREALGSGA